MRIVFLFILISSLAYAQEPPKPYQPDWDRAEQAFRSKRYHTSALLFQKLFSRVRSEEEKQQVLYRIAESYRISNNFKLALKWYEDVINSKYPDPNVLFSYGQLLKNMERYEDASRAFYDYSFENPDDPKGKAAQQSCTVASEWKQHPVKVKIENLSSLNTDQSDYSPFCTGDRLVYTSTRKEAQGTETFEWTGQKYCDLFEAKGKGNTFGKPAPIKALNSNSNEGVAWFDSTQSTVYYTQCNGPDGQGMNCKILVSYYRDGAWQTPKELPFNSDSFSCGHPSLTPDGQRMFFSSDRPGGLGNKDIWTIAYNPVKDLWSEPVNLGPNVNSEEDELFPNFDADSGLYYASKGRIGMGGLDLFRTRDSAGTWTVAQNLRYPWNTGGDDFGLTFVPKSKRIPDQPYAYFCSNRDGGKGDDDLYSVASKPLLVTASILVLERDGNKPIGGATVECKKTFGLQGESKIFTIKTNAEGQVNAELPINELLGTQAGAEKFLSSFWMRTDTRNIQQDTTIQMTFYLDAIPTEEIELVLQGIYYDLDKYDIRPEAAKILDSLAVILKNNPTLVIELASHTDSRAPADYNMTLSQKRAQSCVNYLVGKGIAKDRLMPVGYGETKLVNDCSDGVDCSEEEHQQNRRTTIRVVRTDYKSRR